MEPTIEDPFRGRSDFQFRKSQLLKRSSIFYSLCYSFRYLFSTKPTCSATYSHPMSLKTSIKHHPNNPLSLPSSVVSPPS
ncbi:hypothetical protein M407DRAFT_103265 [Tulasnella calospora MUT 4182]|uniref:Uncharacterized protein n=1 Tax=Tulasnella calospora MUT 4182 TaxID=1051891 RepID=A0A0C3QFS3_9AGAM|nr:hypothetical protein M407DRAFT_103265 [Tulasnella calospora MUT 4182]